MANGMYEVLALIPSSSDFSLERAVGHFGSLHFGKNKVLSEFANSAEDPSLAGFRVWYGDWAIVSWIEDSPSVFEDNRHLASEGALPTTPAVVEACTSRLSVRSDEDPELSHSDEFTDFIEQLQERFEMLIYDPMTDEWWI
jgi:hypothetical protein